MTARLNVANPADEWTWYGEIVDVNSMGVQLLRNNNDETAFLMTVSDMASIFKTNTLLMRGVVMFLLHRELISKADNIHFNYGKGRPRNLYIVPTNLDQRIRFAINLPNSYR